MNREEALNLVRIYVQSESLVRHMLSVEAAMRFYAHRLVQDEEQWGLAGLLHDYDWEVHPNAETHPLEGLALLRQHGVPEAVVHAISSHADHTGIARTSLMDRALYACDEITGMITAVALVRPSHSLVDLEVSSVRKKWKDRAFAAGADRQVMEQAAAEFGVDLWEHVGNVITAMRTIAADLGLEGNN
jgi:putative nucleotidyltransferase with HDIG domain